MIFDLKKVDFLNAEIIIELAEIKTMHKTYYRSHT